MICSRCHNFCTFTIKLNKNQFSSVNIGCLCLQNKILFLNQFLILLHNKSTETQSKGIGKCNIHTNKKYEYYCRTCNALQCQEKGYIYVFLRNKYRKIYVFLRR